MTPAHESLLNHASVIGATCCHPMSGRYCAVGRELWVLDKVAFVLSISDRETRKAVMDTLRDNAPEWAEEIEGRIIRLWTEQRGKQDENRQTANP